MEKQLKIQETANFIRQLFEQDSSGHDWWHIYRVWQLSIRIAKLENADLFRVEMAALLHDLDDWKLNGDPKQEAKAVTWMKKLGLTIEETDSIWSIITEVSFKGAGVDTTPTTAEAMIVQDADRLDAIGAIGIARTFAFGGNRNRMIYDPEVEPRLHQSFSEYKQTTAPTINHFYEKLLLLKDRMNTPTAKEIASKRHHFMENYLEQFYREWNLTE